MTNQNQNQKRNNGGVQPISLDQLRKAASGEVINIPDHTGSETIAVRVKRVDLTSDVLSSGMIPNDLQADVVKQFEKGGSRDQVEKHIEKRLEKELAGDMEEMNKFLPMINKLCEKALMEPTWADFEEIYPLTMPQKMAIFEWLMGEVRQMRSFRDKPRNNGNANRQRKNMGNKTK